MSGGQHESGTGLTPPGQDAVRAFPLCGRQRKPLQHIFHALVLPWSVCGGGEGAAVGVRLPLFDCALAGRPDVTCGPAPRYESAAPGGRCGRIKALPEVNDDWRALHGAVHRAPRRHAAGDPKRHSSSSAAP